MRISQDTGKKKALFCLVQILPVISKQIKLLNRPFG